jgi:hypothetical protein
VDWLKDNAMLVFDDNSPIPSKEIARQSRGQDWTAQQYHLNNRCVIRGCTSIDKDNDQRQSSIPPATIIISGC